MGSVAVGAGSREEVAVCPPPYPSMAQAGLQVAVQGSKGSASRRASVSPGLCGPGDSGRPWADASAPLSLTRVSRRGRLRSTSPMFSLFPLKTREENRKEVG